MTEIHPYPSVATNRAWQLKKTVKERATVKTGLGQTLIAAEKAWKAVPWSVMELTYSQVDKIKDLKDLESKIIKLNKAPALVKTARQQVKLAHAEAEKTANLSTLSKASRAGAAAIVEALEVADRTLDHGLEMAADADKWLEDHSLGLRRVEKLSLKINGKLICEASTGTLYEGGRELRIHENLCKWRDKSDENAWNPNTVITISGVGWRGASFSAKMTRHAREISSIIFKAV